MIGLSLHYSRHDTRGHPGPSKYMNRNVDDPWLWSTCIWRNVVAIAVPKAIRSASIYPSCVYVSRLIDDDQRVSVLIDTGTATCRALATQLHARHLPYLSIQVTGHDPPGQCDHSIPRIFARAPFRPPFLPPLSNCLPSLAIPFRPSAFTDLEDSRTKSKPGRSMDGSTTEELDSLSLFFSLAFSPSSTLFGSSTPCMNS